MQLSDERVRVAFISLLVALILVLIKFGAYLTSASLSVLSEVLHSGLDGFATLITLAAVSYTSRPPDAGHHYGHGKAENLGGLAGALLILATSAWIFYEGMIRLMEGVSFEPSLIAAAVMAISIVVDYERARALKKVAKKYDSQALEADALHFSSDMVSSATVLGVIILSMVLRTYYSAGDVLLIWVDVAVAVSIAAYFAWSSYKLSRKALSELLDRAPKEVVEEVEKITESVKGVIGVRAIRSRRSGSKTFIDMTISVDEGTNINNAHDVAQRVEESIKNRLGDVDLTVHIEPGLHR